MEPSTATKTSARKKSFGREVWEWIKAIAIAVVAYFLITTFVFQGVRVEGFSMADTLDDQERMFVTKYQYLFGTPERFDVVICRYPDRGNTNFVKRVVGIPGDTLSVQGGVLYVNGEAVQEAYVSYPPIDDMAEVTVPDGYYFVMGDNRASSNDSRNPTVGMLAENQITGKVQAVFWPLSEIRRIH